MKWFDEEGITLFEEAEISDDGDEENLVRDHENIPGRVSTFQKRIIRDTLMIRKIKEKYNNKCQICGKTITLPDNKKYSEGHHLKKLGGIHRGPDDADNVIILCPYHHTEFDYGSIAIDPNTMEILHIDTNNEYHRQKLAYNRTDLSQKYIEYHYQNIFNP